MVSSITMLRTARLGLRMPLEGAKEFCLFCLSRFWTVKFVNAILPLSHLNMETVFMPLNAGKIAAVHLHSTLSLHH